jgi:hypothetical protein
MKYNKPPLTIARQIQSLKEKLKKLFTQYPDILLKQMGFPLDWNSEKLWTNKNQ